MSNRWTPSHILGYIFIATLQIGVVLLGLAFAVWAGKMFLRALNF